VARSARQRADQPFTAKGWVVIAGGVATAAVILAAWFPLGALLSQRAQLSTATSRLTELATEGKALRAVAARLDTPEVLNQLAREQYELVEPGQRLVQVLAASGAPTSRASGGPFAGDPGLAPLVAPGGATTTTPSASGTAATAGHGQGGFVSRVLGTLEFWR
jgi:hypothetical protein